MERTKQVLEVSDPVTGECPLGVTGRFMDYSRTPVLPHFLPSFLTDCIPGSSPSLPFVFLSVYSEKHLNHDP